MQAQYEVVVDQEMAGIFGLSEGDITRTISLLFVVDRERIHTAVQTTGLVKVHFSDNNLNAHLRKQYILD